MMHHIERPGIFLIALCLSACGFQLRGQTQLPPELAVVYVSTRQGIGEPPGALSRKLRLLLAENGAKVTRDPAQATASITIFNAQSGRRTISADRLDINREYVLAYNAVYDVQLANGKTLIAREGLSTNRSLLFDETRVLGFEAAQQLLVESMAEELAWQIIRRLQAFQS
ncbi:MAG: hypothetical protein CSA09_04190 [Candidatus Contendobacter odensis]|uniref:LPS-assembly lipoprotein LptE n=1 Tax=Candidatus Contendibacter odensensis TaxID=1400860 RepID=A0A2G6PEM4_9GAMM|nr:MAG: hypothetical protein CSA09_04190 [Candidatus Contendobacter odensis]